MSSLPHAAVPDPLVWGPPGAIPDERNCGCSGRRWPRCSGRRPAESLADRLTERAYRELVRAGRMIDAKRPPFVGARM